MLNKIIEARGGFVRDVKIIEDFFDEEMNRRKLESYYVNPKAREAFYSISRGLHPTSRNRVHLITGTWGSGKSHFGLVIANYLTRNSGSKDFEMIFGRLEEKDPGKASEIYDVRNIDKPYLIILLEGYDPDGAEHALLKGLNEALTDSRRANLPEETLETAYLSALHKIQEWETKKPEFIKELKTLLKESETDIKTLKDDLREFEEDTYRLFKNIHKEITTTSFVPHYEKVSQIFTQVCELLIKNKGYKGIAIMWDQFNEHLEDTQSGELSREVSFLRDFVERVERSSENQLHLVLISHNPPKVYLQGKISKEALDNWMTLEGRFNPYRLTAIEEAEELIDYAITQRRETEEWKSVEQSIERNTKLLDGLVEIGLYPEKDRNWITEVVAKGCFPLHPITTCCLPRISDVVGWQYRTMFTFFEEGTKDGGLTKFINETPICSAEERLNFYTIDRLFDFFEEAIENEPKTRYILDYYKGAIKNVPDPTDVLTQKVLKSIAVIDTIETIPLATPTGLSLSLNIEEQKIKDLLDSLKTSDVLWARANGEYGFTTGQLRFNLEDDLKKAKESLLSANPIHILENTCRPEDIIARGHENKYRVTRKLIAKYITVAGLDNIKPYEQQIKEDYLDGFILYVVAENSEEIEDVKRKAINIKSSQIVVAVPKNPTKICETLKDVKALEQLGKRSSYSTEGTEGYKRWEDRYDNEKKKLNREIENWKTVANLEWFSAGQTVPAVDKKDTDIADYVMFRVFDKTPIVEHRKMANRWVSDQKSDRISLNDQILDIKKEKIDYAWKGKAPPEKAILEQTFDPQGMLKKDRKGNSDYYEIIEPAKGNMKEVWDLMKKYLVEAGPHPKFEKLVKDLQLPPYGLSPRVIELFLSAFFRLCPNRFTIKTKRTKYSPWEFREFIGQTIYDIVNNPDPEKVAIEYREELPVEGDYLLAINSIVAPDRDWGKLPVIDGVGSLFIGWFQNLPPLTKSAVDLNVQTKDFLQKIGELTTDMDMRELLFEKLLPALGIEKELAIWNNTDLQEFESVFKEVVDDLNNYPEEAVKKSIRCFKEVFDVKGDTEVDIMEKVKYWYNELDPAVKQRKFTGDAHRLMKYANIQRIDQFRQKFLIELPKELRLGEFTQWENAEESLKTYQGILTKARIEIEKIHKKVAKPSPKAKKLSKEADSLKDTLKKKIQKAGIKKEEIITLLEELLEEYRK